MTTNLRRAMITIPADLEDGLDELKQQVFYNKSQSQMLQYLLRQGLAKARSQEKNKKPEETA